MIATRRFMRKECMGMTLRRFVVREYPVPQFIGSKLYIQECVGIGLQIEGSSIIKPTPLTNFIKLYYRRKNSGSLSGQSNAAHEICKFLNFCLAMKDKGLKDFQSLEQRGIFGLTLTHASLYITELSIRSRSGELNGKYVYKIVRYLNKFYAWLNEEGMLDTKIKVHYTTKYISSGEGNGHYREVEILKDMFDDNELGTIYPPKKTKKSDRLSDFGKDRAELVKKFLQVAQYEAEDIFLGVCFQFFGGLRRGEVVNLDINSIKQNPDGYYLDVDDRRKILFPNKKSTKSEQVKNPRYQSLFWNSLLKFALKEHMERLNAMKKMGIIKNDKALFVSYKTGEPITGSTYWRQFRDVKKAFIAQLSKEGKLSTVQRLSDVPWSSHLPRGVFTHFCFDAGMSISEVAIARGDSSLNSMLDYIEERTVNETMAEAVDKLREVFGKSENSKINSTITSSQNTQWGMKYD